MAWSPVAEDKYQWWQVDLDKTMMIKMIATQGRLSSNQWVTSYFVAYSRDGLEFHNVIENNQTKVGDQWFVRGDFHEKHGTCIQTR